MDFSLRHDINISQYISKYWKDQNPELDADCRDTYFPPDIRSVLAMDEDYNYKDENGEENAKKIESDQIVWKRIGKVMADYSVFVDKIESSDIKQGGVGNCYFLSVLAAFTSEKQRFIHSLFKTTEKNEGGLYEMVLFIDGQWQIVFVDDWFPINKTTGELFFSKPNGNELWVILLEKAFAKINGGYINMNAGYVSDPIYVISGFPTETFFNDELEESEVFSKISGAVKSNSLICTSTIPDETIRNKGLVESHSYTIISTIDDYKNQNKNDLIKLIKLRNPWSFFEWNGDWSDASEEWTSALKLKYDIVVRDDGIFHMSLVDYRKYFSYFNVSHILYGSYVKCYIINYNRFPNVFNFYLEHDGKVCFSVIKKHWRYNNRNLKHKARPISFILVKYKNKKEILRLDGQYRVYENVEYIEELKAGKYFLFILVPIEYYTYDNELPDQPIQAVFRVCTQSKFRIKFAGVDNNYSLLHLLIVNNIKYDYQHLIDTCKSYFTMPFKILEWSGLKCFVIINKDYYLQAQVSFKEKHKVMNFPIYHDIETKPLKIAPNEGIAIIYQYGDVQGEIRCDLEFSLQVFGQIKIKEKVKRESTIQINNKSFHNQESITNNLNSSKNFSRGNTSTNDGTSSNDRRKPKYRSTKTYTNKGLAKSLTKIPDNNNSNINANSNHEIDNKFLFEDDDFDEDDHPHLNNFFRPDFNFDNAESFTYSVITEDDVNNVPTYEIIYTGRDFVVTELADLKKTYSKQLKRLDEFEAVILNDSTSTAEFITEEEKKICKDKIRDYSTLPWATGKLKDGAYVGRISTNNRPQGLGMFILNSKEIYLGLWENGYLEGYGKVYNKLDKPVFEGNFNQDVKNGLGRFFLKNNEKFEGQFSNNAFNGPGVFYFKDGRYWVGYFVGNGKERQGIQVYPDKRIEIVQYFNNSMAGAKAVDKILFNKFLENNDDIVSKIRVIDKITRQNDILIEKNNIIEKERKENPMDNIELIEDVDEKKRLLKLKRLKELNPFMFGIVKMHKSDEHELELIYLRDDERKAFYMGQINEYNAYEQNGGLMFDQPFCITCLSFYNPNKRSEKYRDSDKDKENSGETKKIDRKKKSRIGLVGETIYRKGEGINLTTANLTKLISSISTTKSLTNFNRAQSKVKSNKLGSSTRRLSNNSIDLLKNQLSSGGIVDKDKDISENADDEDEDECLSKHVKAKYMFGFFENDKHFGRVYLYDDKEKMIYKGAAKGENGLVPHGKGQKFFINGDVYLGDFVEGRMEGEGSLTYSNGDTLVGSFENDQPSGNGVVYEKDNPIPYTISFKGGKKVVTKQKSQPFIEKHCNAICVLYQKYPLLLSFLISYFPPPSENNKLHYEMIVLDENVKYLGQVNTKGELKGRGVMILDDELEEPFVEKYYIGKYK